VRVYEWSGKLYVASAGRPGEVPFPRHFFEAMGPSRGEVASVSSGMWVDAVPLAHFCRTGGYFDGESIARIQRRLGECALPSDGSVHICHLLRK
jgi:hypothetical protein